MKKIVVCFIVWTILILVTSVDAVEITITKENIIPGDHDLIQSEEEGTGLLSYVLASIRDIIFWILTALGTAVFLYTGARLLVARWNAEEFTKSIKSFVYAAVGIFVIVFAWAAVRLVSWISL